MEIPNGIEEIADNAFFCCQAVSVQIPPSVKKIGASAFQYCAALKEIIFSEGLEEIGDWAFSDCNALEEIDLPNTLAEHRRKCVPEL